MMPKGWKLPCTFHDGNFWFRARETYPHKALIYIQWWDWGIDTEQETKEDFKKLWKPKELWLYDIKKLGGV